jgi:ribosome-associated protein
LSKRQAGQGKAPSTTELVRLAGTLALEKKAEHVVLLDLRAFPLNTDFFVVASGRSDLQVRAIADWITDELARRYGIRPWHVEGRAHGRWVLLDYVEWVAHVFHRDTREYYLLERLWGDAPAEELTDEDAPAGDDDGGLDQAD